MNKQAAHRFGVMAEYMCAVLLTFKGYRVLNIRQRNYGGEIDLVATHRGMLVIVEVKARAKREHNADAVTPYKQQRLARAANMLLAEPRIAALASRPDFGVRFDVIWVNPWRLPLHQKDAWRL